MKNFRNTFKIIYQELNYMIQGFGYENLDDFTSSSFKVMYNHSCKILIPLSMICGYLRTFIEGSTGLDIAVYGAFAFLIIAETQTGFKASVIRRGNKIKSRKIGRMILKIGVYSFILYILNTFAKGIKFDLTEDIEINPFKWVYYTVFILITFQLIISYLENLAVLGYSETHGIRGVILNRLNKWFEFDGTKDPDNEINK